MKNEMIQFVDGELKLDVKFDLEKDTVWLNRKQISELFDWDIKTIGKHINNVLIEELNKEEVVAKFATTTKHGAIAGKTQIHQIEYYNLDMVISVGYRVKSSRGIAFRKWATHVLKEYMIQGYAINEKRLAVLERKIEVQQGLISEFAHMAGLEAKDILEVIEMYSKAFDLLDDYDHQSIKQPKGRKTIHYLKEEDCNEIIDKTKFSKQSDLFGKERSKGMLKGILDQIQQNVFGQELYPTLEEKAANLLYLLVKDHIYFDGNKRLAAILFLEFLNQNHALYDSNHQKVLSNDALVAITLMVAQSNPNEKAVMVDLIMNFLV